MSVCVDDTCGMGRQQQQQQQQWGPSKGPASASVTCLSASIACAHAVAWIREGGGRVGFSGF